jgi:dimethylglycine dehydrogenase
MRIEKGYRHWKADLITEFNPFESALDRFVNLDKTFVGKNALEKAYNISRRQRFVMLEIYSDVAVAHPGDSIVRDDGVVGTVTSASWGHRTEKNLAMGFIEPELGEDGYELGIEIIGKVFPAKVSAACQYDPQNSRVRL